MRPALQAAVTLLLLSAAACHHTLPPPAATPPMSPTSAKMYTDPSGQISFQYPSDWTPGHGKTAVFEAASPDHRAKLSLDIPKLPFHFPGMITAGAVANGYISDLKNRLTNANVEQNQELTIADASARRVKITGTDGNATTTDFAVLIVHADRVYILSSDGAGPSAATAAQALDTAVGSLRWGK